MTHEELMDTIKNSIPTDWMSNDKKGEWTYKKDVMLRFKEEGDDQPFDEKWVRKFPDHTASHITYIISYGASFIEEVYAVSVDGDRTFIPLPNSQDNLVITPWQYQFGKILNKDRTSHTLDYQMERAGIRVE